MMMKVKASEQQERREELDKKRKKKAQENYYFTHTVLFPVPYNYSHDFEVRAEIL